MKMCLYCPEPAVNLLVDEDTGECECEFGVCAVHSDVAAAAECGLELHPIKGLTPGQVT